MKKRSGKCLLLYWTVFVLAALVVAAFLACRRAYVGVNDALTAEEQDLRASVYDTLSRVIANSASALAESLGSARAYDTEVLNRAADAYYLDEVNVIDLRGVWIASTESNVVGTSIFKSPKTAVYSNLFTCAESFIAEPFRASLADPSICRLYVAVPFSDGSGVLQAGYNLRDFTEFYPIIFHNFLRTKVASDRHYYIAADAETGEITDCGIPTTARTLAEFGWRFPLAKPPAEAQAIFLQGERVWVKTFFHAGQIFLVVLPVWSFFTDILMIVGVPFLILLILTVVGTVIYRRAQRESLRAAQLRAEEERRNAEDLAMARAIQKSALPAIFPPYPRDFRMDIYALMRPARDVGGDFYDFFYVGTDRLAFLVADVSGKGFPAAMFMMRARTVLRSLMLSVSDLGDAVAETNARLCEENVADMFVTCWVGVFDERSGRLTYVNAGHNPPYLARATGEIEPLESVSGLFLGGMPGVRYRTFSVQLKPGDLCFLYTDGVTEANDVRQQMFGEERLIEVLRAERGLGLARFVPAAQRVAPTPRMVCNRLIGALDAFAAGASQFDDITMLALRYRGNPANVRETYPATLDFVPKMSAFAERTLDAAKCPADVKSDLLVALDEMANNIASYSGAHEMTLEVQIGRQPAVTRFILSDDGQPWNPLEHLDPDISLAADDRAIGGLGILVVKRLMDDVAYTRQDGLNVFSFRKIFAQEEI